MTLVFELGDVYSKSTLSKPEEGKFYFVDSGNMFMIGYQNGLLTTISIDDDHKQERISKSFNYKEQDVSDEMLKLYIDFNIFKDQKLNDIDAAYINFLEKHRSEIELIKARLLDFHNKN